MTTKVVVGSSNEIDSKKAGKDACKKALKDIKNPKLLIVFASSKYNQQELISSIREVSGDVSLVGCSTAGEITSDGPAKESVAIMAIQSDEINITTVNGGKISPNPREAGSNLAKEIMKKAGSMNVDTIFMLIDVLTGNGADTVRGVGDVVGDNTLIVGGASGDDFDFKQTTQYYNDKALQSSLVGVGLSGDGIVSVGVRHGWVPIGTVMTVTKSEGAVLQEVDGKPAIHIYEDYFGKKAEELREEPLAKMAITYPIGMIIEDSDELLVRDPITVDENGAITCAAEVPVGSKVRLLIGNKEEAVKAAQEATTVALENLGEKKPAAAIIFNCIARNKLFGRYAKDEIDAIAKVLGEEVPIIGFYTYGEIAPFNDKSDLTCRFHNETAVIMVIGK
ncbi:MAG: FIST C-terminal domain-containing protein [Candidatus Pacebacteria bacterium]|nr:FIST C-terminal domain-containing protein [Candidatus Paceibacterota bacterium]